MNDKYKIPYINVCVRAFAKRFHLSIKNAFLYLYRFKGMEFLDEFYEAEHLQSIDDAVEGMEFLDEFYEAEHLQSIDDAVDDLIIICQKNGGQLA